MIRRERHLRPDGHLAWAEDNRGNITAVQIWSDGVLAEMGGPCWGWPGRTGKRYCYRAFRYLRLVLRVRARTLGRPVRYWPHLANPIARSAFYNVFGTPSGTWSFVEVQPDGKIVFQSGG